MVYDIINIYNFSHISNLVFHIPSSTTFADVDILTQKKHTNIGFRFLII